MEFNLFGYTLKFDKETRKLQELGAEAKKVQSWQKIQDGLDHMDLHQQKYSEYQLQKISGVSINTIKKYRHRIAKYRDEANTNLFNERITI